MENSPTSLFAFAVFFFFICTQARWNHHAKHKRTCTHEIPSISEPPSLPPEIANQPDVANQPGSASQPEPGNPPDDRNFNSSSGIFEERKFGAVGDGTTDDTEAYRMAWDAACQTNSAIIHIPSGFKFMIQPTIFTGPCHVGLVFRVEGILMPPDGPDSWPQKYSKRQWLVFYKVNEMSLQGGGVIDGRGQKWWDLPCKPHKAVRFFMSSNLTVQALRIKNSPQFHFRFDGCRNVCR